MPPLRLSEFDSLTMAKFIRVGERLFAGDVSQFSHADLAKVDNLVGEIDRLKRLEPRNVDAGFLTINPVSEKVSVTENSTSLGLDTLRERAEARADTLRCLSEQNPEYTIVEF